MVGEKQKSLLPTKSYWTVILKSLIWIHVVSGFECLSDYLEIVWIMVRLLKPLIFEPNKSPKNYLFFTYNILFIRSIILKQFFLYQYFSYLKNDIASWNYFIYSRVISWKLKPLLKSLIWVPFFPNSFLTIHSPIK